MCQGLHFELDEEEGIFGTTGNLAYLTNLTQFPLI